ncbi:hypothetical protein [Pseudalkalibacillus sp. SCS-8]|uniref:hypothetical protein n=1 Tax=Pseudalkalibacillus nanhaiensis TaxID=3115291 RepID=UPI0032D9E723
MKQFLSLLVLLTLIGCNSSLENKDIEEVNSSAELIKDYATLKELMKDAVLISNVKVLSQETIVHEGVPFTISEVEIIKNYKGKEKKGKIIKVIETGGIYTPKGKSEEDLDKVEYQINGVSTMENGEEYYLFLEEFVGPQVDGAYIPLGAYQGKFKVNKNKITQETDYENKIKDFTEIDVEEFKNKLKDVNN